MLESERAAASPPSSALPTSELARLRAETPVLHEQQIEVLPSLQPSAHTHRWHAQQRPGFRRSLAPAPCATPGLEQRANTRSERERWPSLERDLQALGREQGHSSPRALARATVPRGWVAHG